MAKKEIQDEKGSIRSKQFDKMIRLIDNRHSMTAAMKPIIRNSNPKKNIILDRLIDNDVITIYVEF